MKVTLENTDKVVGLVINGTEVPARIWEGETADGIKCHAYITRICVHKDDDAAEFERDLRECKPLSPDLAALNLRLIL